MREEQSGPANSSAECRLSNSVVDFSISLIASFHQHAAVDLDRLAAEITRLGGKKNNDLRDFRRRAHSTHRNHIDVALHHFRRRELFVERRIDYSGRHRVHAHTVRCQFLSKPLGESYKATLSRGIVDRT